LQEANGHRNYKHGGV